MTTAETLAAIRAALDEVERAVVGKSEVVRMAFMTFLAGGHVLFEDFPGLGKTLIARSLATVLGLDFKRIQFTPDLLPSDIVGGSIYLRDRNVFELRRGPVFTNVLLADEINRASPKTQSALLEAMQESRVTIEGQTHKLPSSFFVMATQNPVENEGTFPLPEAQLDRFMVRLSVGYPDEADEVAILQRRIERKADDVELTSRLSGEDLIKMRQEVEAVAVHPDVLSYVVKLVAATRENEFVEMGASPRASLGIVKLARAQALCSGRSFVIPDDVKLVFPHAINHRFFLKPEFWIEKGRKTMVIESILRSVTVPLLEKR